MTLQLHRPDGRGGLVRRPRPGGAGRGLAGRPAVVRWRVAPLGNSEMNPTSTRQPWPSGSCWPRLTFALLLLGYGSHFWH